MGVWEVTVWKYQDFSVIQILREINFGEHRNSKTGVFDIYEALIFDKSAHFTVWKFQDFSVIQILREINFG